MWLSIPAFQMAAAISLVQSYVCSNETCKEKWELPDHAPLKEPLRIPCEKCENVCTCDVKSNKTLVCYNKACGAKWSVPKEAHERRADCPVHRHCIAICSFPVNLCAACTDAGLKLELVGDGWPFRSYRVLDAAGKEVAETAAAKK